MEGLKDKVFIVTGGGSGIGADTVRRLLAEGARVTAAGTNAEKLARTREQASEAADRLLTVQFDLRDEDSIASLVAQTTDRFGRLDGVTNVAAAVSADLMARDQGVDTMDPGVWAEMMRINVTGAGLMIRESLPALVASGGGSIVNVSSLAAWQPESAPAAYASSKIALHALTRHTAQAWGQKNIRANAVAPGVVLTQKFPRRPCALGLPCGCRRVTQRFGRGHSLRHPRRCLIPVSLRNIKVPFVTLVALLHSGLTHRASTHRSKRSFCAQGGNYRALQAAHSRLIASGTVPTCRASAAPSLAEGICPAMEGLKETASLAAIDYKIGLYQERVSA
ncbi:SDR family NAD(P)-dependent oxidoreductase [Streptomyces sp. NPDC001978]